MKIKTALIDLDDTICNTKPLYDEALRACTLLFNEKSGLKLSEEKFISEYYEKKEYAQTTLPSTTARHNRALYFQLIVEDAMKSEDRNSDLSLELALQLYDKYYEVVLNGMQLFPEAESFLIWLKESGRKIVLLSNGTTEIRLRKIQKLGLTRLVDFLVSSEEAGSDKPSVTPFTLALQKSNSLPHEAFMLGNDPASDIYGANTIGIETILVAKDRNVSWINLPNSQKPKYTVSNLNKVKDIIEYIETNR